MAGAGLEYAIRYLHLLVGDADDYPDRPAYRSAERDHSEIQPNEDSQSLVFDTRTSSPGTSSPAMTASRAARA